MKLTHIIQSAAAVLALTVALGVSSARADSGIPKSYPLKTCPVSGDKLGEHGKSVKVTAPDGTDVYLCCKDCLKDFKKDPEKYAKMVKDAKK
jgi:YHS domain-containing protein